MCYFCLNYKDNFLAALGILLFWPCFSTACGIFRFHILLVLSFLWPWFCSLCLNCEFKRHLCSHLLPLTKSRKFYSRHTSFLFTNHGCFLVFTSTVSSAANQPRFNQGILWSESTPSMWLLLPGDECFQLALNSTKESPCPMSMCFEARLVVCSALAHWEWWIWLLWCCFPFRHGYHVGIPISAQGQVHIIFSLGPFFPRSLTRNQI